MSDLDKKIMQLQDVINIQSSNGNYDCNPYMLGLGNGLILAMSILTRKEPKYLDAPKKWLDDEQSEELNVVECTIVR